MVHRLRLGSAKTDLIYTPLENLLFRGLRRWCIVYDFCTKEPKSHPRRKLTLQSCCVRVCLADIEVIARNRMDVRFALLDEPTEIQERTHADRESWKEQAQKITALIEDQSVRKKGFWACLIR